MKKSLLPIIVIIIVIIIAITIALLILKDKLIIEGEEIGHIDFSELDEVTDRNDYYMVKTILNKYYYAINYLEADIKDLDVEYTDSENEQKEIIEEYTKIGIETLQQILDKECIEFLALDENNIVENFKQYKNSEYAINEMYYVQKNINTNLYFIKGLLDYEKEFKLIVKTDSYTGTFSIYSAQYIEQKSYNEQSIQTEFNIEGVEYISKNDNNQYVKNDITDKNMAQYYLYDYGNLATNYPEKAYEKLDEEYKKVRFPTLEDYKSYLESSGKRNDLLQLQEYSIEEQEEYTIFTCKDQYGDTYIFKDKNIMNYTLQLDNYALENEAFNKNYNSSSDKEKVKLNIEKFINMINMGDYKSAYDLLDSKFKVNKFPTLEQFESYIKTKTFNHNRIVYNAYSDNMSPVYIFNITLKDITKESNESNNLKVLVKLLEDTNFVMSFEID